MTAAPLLLALALTAPGPAIVADHRAADAVDGVGQPWLDRARAQRVVFGHQSVGNNILAGLRELARQAPGRYQLAVHGVRPAELAGGGVGQFGVGKNGDPRGKIEDFARRVDELGDGEDVAMMKLCFVDFPRQGGEPDGLFEAYRDTMERLERAHPGVRLVWWTAPLAARGNAARLDYNRRVREYALAHGKALFDLADLESHDPSGREASDGAGPILYAGYTQDGGHLAPEGQLRAARAWWWLMARLAGWPGVEARPADATPPPPPPPPPAPAPAPAPAGGGDWWSACAREREAYCQGVPVGGGRVVRCLDEHQAQLSAACRAARASR